MSGKMNRSVGYPTWTGRVPKIPTRFYLCTRPTLFLSQHEFWFWVVHPPLTSTHGNNSISIHPIYYQLTHKWNYYTSFITTLFKYSGVLNHDIFLLLKVPCEVTHVLLPIQASGGTWGHPQSFLNIQSQQKYEQEFGKNGRETYEQIISNKFSINTRYSHSKIPNCPQHPSHQLLSCDWTLSASASSNIHRLNWHWLIRW